MQIIEGNLIAHDARIAIVVSRFNSFINEHLLSGALDVLKRQGEVNEDNINLFKLTEYVELDNEKTKRLKVAIDNYKNNS